MEEFHVYVHRVAPLRYMECYPFNEILNRSFLVLSILSREKANMLIITEEHFYQEKDYVITSLASIGRHERDCKEAKALGENDCMTYREAIALILERDEKIGERFRLVENTPERVRYLLPDEDPEYVYNVSC